MLTKVRPIFLYPTSRQFPVDAVCETIVRELEKRNWSVPGITAHLHTYGSGEQKYQIVQYLTGQDFKLWFCRVQGTLQDSGLNNIAAVARLTIPGKEISIYEDESGPSLNVYVGNNWAADRDWFMNGSKIHTRMDNEPRRHLHYSGSISIGRRSGYSNQRPPFLVADDDLGRLYNPTAGEPTHYSTSDILEEFSRWLEINVLSAILAQPEQAAPEETADQLTEFPAEIVGPFYSFIETRAANRIMTGQADPNKLPASERYALDGGGWRLVSLDIRNDGTVPKIAYDGFLWCLPGEIKPDTKLDDLPEYVGGHSRWDAKYVVAIKPKHADDIYIVDMAPQRKYRRDLLASFPTLERMTTAQYMECYRIPGRTIVPVSEYTGGYEEPVILVKRELDFDEVELVIKPNLMLSED